MLRELLKPGTLSRTAQLRSTMQRNTIDWRRYLHARAFGWGLVIWGLFVLVVGGVTIWTRDQPRVAVGRVMQETRTVRASFEVTDDAATQQARNFARGRARRVYVAIPSALQEIAASLQTLPKALADAPTLDAVQAGIREQFGLTPEALAAIRAQYVDGKPSDYWASRVQRLEESLQRTPLLDREVYQVEFLSPNEQVELRVEGVPTEVVRKGACLNVESATLREDLRALAARSGFEGILLDVVVNRLTRQPEPTFAFDQGATTATQDDAAAHEPVKRTAYPDGQVIFRRGDVLTQSQMEVFQTALAATRAQAAPWQTWLARAAVLGLVGAVALALAGYTFLFCPRIRRNPLRMAAVAALLAAGAAVACFWTASQPSLIALSAVAPTIFLGVILVIAYDQRVALAYGALHATLVCLALDEPVGLYTLIVAGLGLAVWQLREIRDRNTLIRMGVVTALGLGAGMLIVGLVELPVTAEALVQDAWDAGLAAFGGLLIGGVTLFVLPGLERAFDITTGMTLIELRDPKQPLLRQLQQRAPGTYNHSLNVASLAEAAADAVGANGLLTYVGALYHDLGKINKPDYFVENQAPGLNKHDKLSPAMSLLVIVGHVKDGMELAREFRLPRAIQHFIESHHGTTLVEYFYQRARKQAAADPLAESGAGPPAEIEYRYPGPKPRTREAAILMLCDAVESTTRTVAEPTPSRIDTIVHAIATKRLMDGQFDESDLTLRDLNTIVETVSRTLAAIYHGRIAYPTMAAGGGTGPSVPLAGPAGAGPKTGTAGQVVSNGSGGTPGLGPVVTTPARPMQKPA